MSPIPTTTFAVLALALALAGAGAGVDARPEPGLCSKYNLDQKYYWNWGKPEPYNAGKCSFPYDRDSAGNTLLGDRGLLVIAVPMNIVKGNLTVETELSRGSVKYDLFVNEFGYYVIVFEEDSNIGNGVSMKILVRWCIDGQEVASGLYAQCSSAYAKGGKVYTDYLSHGHIVETFGGVFGTFVGPTHGHVAVVQFS